MNADRVKIGFLAAGRADGPLGRDDIAALEGSGCDSLWSAGHVSSGKPVPEAMMGLARLASLTERVTVGSAVLLVPLYHPVIVAKQAAELDRVTGGRITLGVGIGGEYPQEFAMCGVPLAERGPRTDEAIGIMRALFSDGPAPTGRRFWTGELAPIDPLPVQPGGPPLIVAGRKPPAMRRAARLGDGWMPFLYSPDAYAASVSAILEEAAASGRPLTSFQWMCFVFVRIDDDPAAARSQALRFIGAAQAGDPARFEAVVDRLSAVGTPAMVAAQLQRFIDAGARHLILACCGSSDLTAQANRAMTEVWPLLDLGGSQ